MLKKHRFTLLSFLLIFALILVACGGDEAGPERCGHENSGHPDRVHRLRSELGNWRFPQRESGGGFRS